MNPNEVCQNFNIAKYDSILERGLTKGMGKQGEQVCIEAAICETLGLVHSDDPKCVASSVRTFKIALNDKNWSSNQARAKGLRDLGIAQLGSLGVVNSTEFSHKLAKRTIQVIIASLLRELYPNNQTALDIAIECEREGTKQATRKAKQFFNAYAAYAAATAAAYAADAAAAYAADAAAAYAAANKTNPDKYLLMSANLALEILKEMNSPGVKLLG